MDKSLISVITVSFNAEKDIEKTILSVINQSYQEVEYIIIDGGSTDGTVEIIKKYSDKISYWVSEPDGGIYNAMNKGIDKSHGQWLNFMNAGDLFYSNSVIEEVVNLSSNEDFIAGIASIPNGKYWKPVQQDFTLLNIFKGGGVNHQASFVSKKLLSKGYDDTLKIIADEKLFFEKVVMEQCSYLPLNVIVCEFDTNGISNQKGEIEIDRERLKYYKELLPMKIYRDYEKFYILRKFSSLSIIKYLARKILTKMRSFR